MVSLDKFVFNILIFSKQRVQFHSLSCLEMYVNIFILQIGPVVEIWKWVIPHLIMIWIRKFTKLGIKKSTFCVRGRLPGQGLSQINYRWWFQCVLYIIFNEFLDDLIDVSQIISFLMYTAPGSLSLLRATIFKGEILY